MCDDGIEEVFDDISNTIRNLFSNVIQEIKDKEEDTIKIVDGKIQNWRWIEKKICNYIVDNLDDECESIVEKIDNRMCEVHGEGQSDGYCNGYSEAQCEFDSSDQIEKLEKRIEELEEQENEIIVDGIEYTWIPEKQRFVSDVGRVYAFQEVDDIVSAG